MNSMTGYGKANFVSKKRSIGVEISSVNNRFLEFNIRLPRELNSLEPRVKELICEKIKRGKINVSIVYSEQSDEVNKLVLNKALAKNVYSQLLDLKKTYKLSGEIDINHFLNFPEILTLEKVNNYDEKVWPKLEQTINRAMSEMLLMRKKEGANLKKDISKRLTTLLNDIQKIEKLAANDKNLHRKRLSAKIKDLIDNKAIDGLRLEEEIAYIVERSDVTEECVRFRSHIHQFQSSLKQDGQVGKKINFILQELNRESNTIGSKAANADIARIAVELKEGIEKIREQIQNIE